MGKEERNSPNLDSIHLSGKPNISDVIDVSDEDDDIKIINMITNDISCKGEYSYSKGWRFKCILCLDTKRTWEAFYVSGYSLL
ncbi:hypothetical protein TSUD_284830 [Trifolium subterraneum]|uniref:Uncharacterized protein n=1 Tax=Trifolium subterraneum TaxID=3900 RepID=A0A2Z6P4W6_TRISU|nr:hypothetical protein TSUD_284830 [Trifolium subterraneum]